MVPFPFCGCQRHGPQQHQSTFQRLAHTGCAYSEVPVADRDELSSAVAWSIHHWIQGSGPRWNQQMESHYLDHSPLWSDHVAVRVTKTQGQRKWEERSRYQGRTMVGQRETTASNAMINSRGISICQKHQYFLLRSCFRSGWFNGWL